ncbi:IclR family transcriptional regulator [Nakamurella lactea]|uniref:IclR family transcriptional regulator n=1 Tax=Nakamurella lactea TaxID=459515 RepID=UPI0003FCE636|nr:IclR family transcriptional regulator [Nakamurella lactea]
MAADADSPTAYPIRSVDRVCDILDTLANSSMGVTLTEVSEATGLPKSSTFRYLSALEARHYVERANDNVSYRLGPAFRPQHTRRISQLAELARPALERLRDKIDETTNLGLLDGTSVVHSVVCESKQMMRLAAHVGDRGYVHATALGKAMAATLPDDRVRSILTAAGMPVITSETITDPDAFLAELGDIRESGYAIDHAENQGGGLCVAAAIQKIGFPAAVSVSAPSSRFTPDQVPAVAKSLQKIAKDLSRQMRS